MCASVDSVVCGRSRTDSRAFKQGHYIEFPESFLACCCHGCFEGLRVEVKVNNILKSNSCEFVAYTMRKIAQIANSKGRYILQGTFLNDLVSYFVCAKLPLCQFAFLVGMITRLCFSLIKITLSGV